MAGPKIGFSKLIFRNILLTFFSDFIDKKVIEAKDLCAADIFEAESKALALLPDINKVLSGAEAGEGDAVRWLPVAKRLVSRFAEDYLEQIGS